MMTENLIHATSIALDGRGLLLRGASGAGKSDLALRLIADHEARLISDDQTLLSRAGNELRATAPERLCGILEVRGIGIVPFDRVESAPVVLVIDLSAAPERLPDPAYADFLGLRVRRICLDPFETSVVQKIQLALELTGK